MATAAKAYRSLRGVFAVYKMPNVSINSLIKNLNAQILQGLNGLEQRPQKCIVALKRLSKECPQEARVRENTTEKLTQIHVLEDTIFPINTLDWFDNPLVQGPRYTEDDLKWHFGHTLDYEASGVQVLGLQSKGAELLRDLNWEKYYRTYEVRGRLGLDTSTCTMEGKVLERTGWKHIRASHIEKVLALIQGSHRNSLMRLSEIDMKSHEAYVAACKGEFKPPDNYQGGPLFNQLELVNLCGPEFTLQVSAYHESCQSIRELVSELGKRLYSGAVTTKLRRIADPPFHSGASRNRLPRTDLGFRSQRRNFTTGRPGRD